MSERVEILIDDKWWPAISGQLVAEKYEWEVELMAGRNWVNGRPTEGNAYVRGRGACLWRLVA
jgi:hypothetical protein